MGQRHPLRRIAGFRIQQRHRQPVGHHVEHRNPDIGALAGASPRDQGFENGGMRGGAGGDIDHGNADPRRSLRSAGDRGQPALGLDQQIIGLAVGVGAVVAIAGNGAADQFWVIFSQALQREAELVHRSRLEILQQHIRAGDQRFERGAAFLGREVDDGGILAAVEPDEVAALSLGRGIVAAGKVAFRPLHLDDMGAGIRQPRAAEGGGDRLFDGNDGQSLKRQHVLTSQ